MANHKSAIKRIQIGERNRLRNRHYKTRLKTQIKKLRSIESREEGEKVYRDTTALLDKLATKGIIHKNKAANQKSKLAAFVQRLEA